MVHHIFTRFVKLMLATLSLPFTHHYLSFRYWTSRLGDALSSAFSVEVQLLYLVLFASNQDVSMYTLLESLLFQYHRSLE